MAALITISNIFQAQAGPIPLSQLDTNFTQCVTALNTLATFNNYYTDTSGTPNILTVTVPATQTVAYTAGLNIQVKVANANTGAMTINVNGLGSKSITNADLSAVSAGLVPAGAVLDLTYDGTQFQIQGGTIGGINSVPATRTISTTAPLTGGGALSGNLSLAVSQFGAAASGVVPASGGGTTSFLRADGTWTTPPNSGGTVTSVTGTGTVNGLTLSGTGSGSVTLTLGGGISGSLASCTVDGTNAVGYRNLPQSTNTTPNTTDVGKSIITSGTITIPNNVFSAGDAFTIVNNNAASITITASVATLHFAGTATTGNRTLAQWGQATVYFISPTVAVISGAGLT
jgi:hypothetical protein